MNERYLADPQGAILVEAELDDILAILALQKSTFPAAYSSIAPAVALEAHANDPDVLARWEEDIRDAIISPEKAIYVVKQKSAGIISYGKAEKDENGKHWNSALAVGPKWRDKDLARELVRERIGWHDLHDDNPPVDIYVEAVTGSEAERFHRHLGFRNTGFKEKTVDIAGGIVVFQLACMRLAARHRDRLDKPLNKLYNS